MWLFLALLISELKACAAEMLEGLEGSSGQSLKEART